MLQNLMQSDRLNSCLNSFLECSKLIATGYTVILGRLQLCRVAILVVHDCLVDLAKGLRHGSYGRVFTDALAEEVLVVVNNSCCLVKSDVCMNDRKHCLYVHQHRS